MVGTKVLRAMTVRCAIYTRKSTEEGLDQDFNSLDAQREACEAFAKSQKGLGWRIIHKRYDDGGISGGTMNRPALQDLLADIDAAKVDLVIVYKVDRLTRSLMDFAKIIETFDAKEVSFVSVTQQFNTANSMGRLTLNVLLSFAQFEREVTAERIRDKIAASKRKGMWMGGPPPLGYDVVDRKLHINPREAITVRRIFETYLESGSVRGLKEELNRLEIVTKVRVQKNGKRTGGKPFSRGNLYRLLSNPIYIGRVAHKGETFEGQHEGIIDETLWARGKGLLAENATDRLCDSNSAGPFLLTGKIHDEDGQPLYQSQAQKDGKRYCYYISKHLIHAADRTGDGWRLAAKAVEEVVTDVLTTIFRNEGRLNAELGIENPTVSVLTRLSEQARGLLAVLSRGTHSDKRRLLQSIVHRVDLYPNAIAVTLDKSAVAEAFEIPEAEINGPEPFNIPIRLRRRGVEMKLIIDSPDTKPRDIDPNLCPLLVRAISIGESRNRSGNRCT